MAPFGNPKRNVLTINEKIKILEAVDKGVRTKSDIAKDFGIPKSTLFTIIANRKGIKDQKKIGVAPGRSRVHNGKYPELEKALLEWLKLMRANNTPIDGNILKTKAETFALRMELPEFKVSNGWFQKFQERHGLIFKKVCGESAAVNPQTTKNWQENRLQELMSSYDPADIFNADETGLFYKMLPDRTLTIKGEQCSGGKKAKDRITVLLAANMTGTEKLPLLIIGKYAKPRCFKGIKTLPTTYRFNKKAWMTTDIFEDWVKDLELKMKRQNRKVLLILDNCTAHCEVPQLNFVKIEFLPPNVTAVLQPMDQGVIQCFKKKYRSLLLNRFVLCMENQKDYEVDILKAIHFSFTAWNDITAETIANCFRHAGFLKKTTSNETTPTPKDAVVSEGCATIPETVRRQMHIAEEVSFQDYVDIDANVECCNVYTSEEEIIARIGKEDRASSSSD